MIKIHTPRTCHILKNSGQLWCPDNHPHSQKTARQIALTIAASHFNTKMTEWPYGMHRFQVLRMWPDIQGWIHIRHPWRHIQTLCQQDKSGHGIIIHYLYFYLSRNFHTCVNATYQLVECFICPDHSFHIWKAVALKEGLRSLITWWVLTWTQIQMNKKHVKCLEQAFTL